MTDRTSLARSTPVSVCEGLLEIEPLIVGPDDDVLDVLRLSAARPSTRVIGVVDGDGRLIGILPIVRIAEAVVGRVMPEMLLSDIMGVADVERFGHAVEARTAGEAMLPPASIRPEASIADAYRAMHARHLSGLYVVDENNRPSGYIDLLELGFYFLKRLTPDGAAVDGAAVDAAAGLGPPGTGEDPGGSGSTP